MGDKRNYLSEKKQSVRKKNVWQIQYHQESASEESERLRAVEGGIAQTLVWNSFKQI